MKAHWTDELVKMDACAEAVEWARTQPSLARAWRVCPRGDWMLWLAGKRHVGRKRLAGGGGPGGAGGAAGGAAAWAARDAAGAAAWAARDAAGAARDASLAESARIVRREWPTVASLTGGGE